MTSYQQGKQACRMDKMRLPCERYGKSNPYSPLTEKYNDWEKGWNDEHEDTSNVYRIQEFLT